MPLALQFVRVHDAQTRVSPDAKVPLAAAWRRRSCLAVAIVREGWRLRMPNRKHTIHG